MPRRRRLNDDQVADLLAWAANRMPLKAKAAQLGASVSTVQRVLRNGGYKPARPRAPRRMAACS
jgi:hypothetical protein